MAMIEKVYLVTDLGPGDGGKGGVVHKIANTFQASVVLKFGGGQGSHGVVSDAGEKFAFSHWGCGTLEGIPSVITPQFVTIPHAILMEGRALEKMGINDPCAMLKIDPQAICATVFHQFASQIKELFRKDKPRGTIGTGAGEAYRLSQKSDDLTIRMCELNNPDVVKIKLQNIAQFYRSSFSEMFMKQVLRKTESEAESDFLEEDADTALNLFEALNDERWINWSLEQYTELMKTSMELVRLDEVMQRFDGIAVAECSHGVLTDAECGFKPHVSAIRTLPEFAISVLREHGFSGKMVCLGATRAYAIRHGAGPLPTADDALRQRLLPNSHKQVNRWQGEVRVGALDFNLLRYAIQACGGAGAFDGLCITCFDQIMKDGVWQFCDEYENSDSLTDCEHFTQTIINESLVPKITAIDCSKMSKQEMIDKCCQLCYQQLQVPVRLIALGPSDQDKILI